jgi:enamine deaminase RidA (YjgF/YER057c/UK114 family)
MRRFALVVLACALAMTAWPFGKKQKKEPETQILQLPKALPAAVIGETRRMAFYVTPLSAHGLLSQQIRDALKALNRATNGAAPLKLRAFVAGTGDLRRVRDIVSETYTSHRQPLPALSLVQAGGLPLEGAQVVFEAIAAAKKDVNPSGLAFISAQPATSPNPLDPVLPLAEKSLAALRIAVAAAGAQPEDVLRVTCFFSSLDNLPASRKLAMAEYPAAALDFVQPQRAPTHALAACEAVARLRTTPPEALQTLDPEGLPREAGQSQIALAGAPRLILTATQVSFGFTEADAKLALGRIRKAVEQLGGTLERAVFASYYPLSPSLASQVRRARTEFFSRTAPPAATVLSFESLPSMDAGFAVDVIAVKE